VLRDTGTPLAGDVIVAGVADEEYGSLGTAGLLRVCPVDGAIVTEPTALRTCLAHKGYVWLRVVTHGRGAHGSRFEDGIDANLMMGRILYELSALEQSLRTGPCHPLVGPASIHAPLLEGGTGISTYADRCVLQIERRTIPGETLAAIEAQISEVVERAGAGQTGFRATIETFFVREPFEVDPTADVVRAVDEASRKHLSQTHPHIGDTPWMDAALLAAGGVETVVIGPAGAGAHAAEEWVDVDSVVTLAAILADAAIEYCGVE
jgi:acetylornithine deacetylase